MAHGFMVFQLLTRAQVTLFLIKIKKKRFEMLIIWLFVILELLDFSEDGNVLLCTLTDNGMMSEYFGVPNLCVTHPAKR
jgi:hypothetical protein